MKKYLTLVGMLALCALTYTPSTVSSRSTTIVAKDQTDKIRRQSRPIPNQYIVVLKDYAADPKGPLSLAPQIAADVARNYGGKIDKVFTHAVHGFSLQLTEEADRKSVV